MSCLLILGAGGHAKVVAETAIASGHFSEVAFLDDRSIGLDQHFTVLGFPVLGPLALAFEPANREKFTLAAVAFGNAAFRLNLIDQLHVAGYALPTLIHPTAWVSPSAQLASGSVVFAQAVVQSLATIGSGAILNTGCSVDHDTQLFDGVHICPGARLAGEVVVGARSWIGIGSSVIQQVRIGADVTVGAGAAVVRDLPDGVLVVGVPARVITKS